MEKTFMQNFHEIKKTMQMLAPGAFTDQSDFAFQMEITGEGAGIFYIANQAGTLSIEPYDYQDHTARIRASAAVMLDLIEGRITVYDALRFGDVDIIPRAGDGLPSSIRFFAACHDTQVSQTSFRIAQNKPFAQDKSTVQNKPTAQNKPAARPQSSAWDNLRVYIEGLDIDLESKTQLLANLVKFTSRELHILIVGACGCGKSSTINALFNTEIAQVGYGVEAETQFVSAYKMDNLYLHDTPGLGESTEKDKLHIQKIVEALQETDEEGNARIDVVFVIIDGSHRDMRTSFELINEVIIPNMRQKDRILVGINRCDLALDGRGWIERYQYPDEELLQRLQEKAASVRRRIKEDTGVDVEPVFYSALHKYNISKLLSYLVKSAPAQKRVFFAEKINKNPDHFVRDDTVTLVRRNRAGSGPQNTERPARTSYENRSPDSHQIYKEVSSVKSAVSGLEKKIDALHNECKKSNDKQKSSGPKSSEFKTPAPKSETPAEPEYEFVRTRQTTH